MKKKITIELQNIAHKILNIKDLYDINALQIEAKILYEKLTVLQFIEKHLHEEPSLHGKSDVVKKFEELAESVIMENTQVPENNPHEEDLVQPLMHTIKDLVAEMPREETLNDILADVRPNPTFIKKEEKPIPDPILTQEMPFETKKRSLNDLLKKGIQIGLNDKIGFIKHLFNGKDDDFNRVLSQLNTMNTYAEAKNFISTVVKPNYDYWDGKELYEMRFLERIEAKFTD